MGVRTSPLLGDLGDADFPPDGGAFTLLSFMGTWNSFLWRQIILHTPEKITLPLALASMMGLQEYQSDGRADGGNAVVDPAGGAAVLCAQPDFIAGLASGAIKG